MNVRPFAALLLATAFLLPGCGGGDKGKEVKDKLTADAPKLCDAYCGVASCGFACKDTSAVEPAKEVLIKHCAEIKALGTPITVVSNAVDASRQPLDLKTCTFAAK